MPNNPAVHPAPSKLFCAAKATGAWRAICARAINSRHHRRDIIAAVAPLALADRRSSPLPLCSLSGTMSTSISLPSRPFPAIFCTEHDTCSTMIINLFSSLLGLCTRHNTQVKKILARAISPPILHVSLTSLLHIVEDMSEYILRCLQWWYVHCTYRCSPCYN